MTIEMHAVPYAGGIGPSCLCPEQKCGGITPVPDCPDHGDRRNPAMSWHRNDGPSCRRLAGTVASAPAGPVP